MREENRNNLKSKNENSYKVKKNNDEKKMKLTEESAACTGQKQSSKKRSRKEVAIFGNYWNYYGYRIGQDVDEDPRLRMMKREWFEGKDYLDIGCNSGLITIAIVSLMMVVHHIPSRIGDALSTLRKVIRTSMHTGTSKIDKSEDVELANGLENNTTETLIDEKGDDSGYPAVPVEGDLLKVVFQKGNFVQSWHPPSLSVAKWIHLNWGDDGVITLFWRVWKLLQPGGIFILEPQPWSSYCNNRKVSEIATTNYKSIQIRPEDFQDILLDKIGFRRVENITTCLSGTKSGFDRPILAFWK
ncbi:hypothetical protein OROMI_018777 [Orobanche minor]